jgi:hypothetical protein
MSTLVKVAATGNVTPAARGQLRSVILTPAAAIATLDIRLDGSGGTVVASLQAAASGNSVVWAAAPRQAGVAGAGVPFPGPVHATLAGAGASATFEYD